MQLSALPLLGSQAEEKAEELANAAGGRCGGGDEPPVCGRVNKSVIKSRRHFARHAQFSRALEKIIISGYYPDPDFKAAGVRLR